MAVVIFSFNRDIKQSLRGGPLTDRIVNEHTNCWTKIIRRGFRSAQKRYFLCSKESEFEKELLPTPFFSLLDLYILLVSPKDGLYSFGKVV